MRINVGNTAYLLTCLMDNVSDHIYFKDLDSKFIMMNEAAARWEGNCTPAEMIGKSDFDVFTREHAEQAFADEQQIIQTGKPIYGLEEKETWPDGRVTWVSSTKMPLKNETGEIIGTFGIAREITAKKRAENQLRESEARFRLLVEHAPDASVILDIDQGRFTDANIHAENLFQMKRE